MTKDERFMELIRARRPGMVTDVRDQLRARYGRNVRLARPRGQHASIISFHHTASQAKTGVDGALAASWDYHIRSLGWSTGGYCAVVTLDGHIYIAASPFADMTYNAGARWNPITIAVVAVGCFHAGVRAGTSDDGTPRYLEETVPTPELLQSLYSVGLSLDDASTAKAGLPWRPHRTLKQTSCPGDGLVDHIWAMTGTQYGAAPLLGNARPEHYP